jgi:hypothetical protein
VRHRGAADFGLSRIGGLVGGPVGGLFLMRKQQLPRAEPRRHPQRSISARPNTA